MNKSNIKKVLKVGYKVCVILLAGYMRQVEACAEAVIDVLVKLERKK